MKLNLIRKPLGTQRKSLVRQNSKFDVTIRQTHALSCTIHKQQRSVLSHSNLLVSSRSFRRTLEALKSSICSAVHFRSARYAGCSWYVCRIPEAGRRIKGFRGSFELYINFHIGAMLETRENAVSDRKKPLRREQLGIHPLECVHPTRIRLTKFYTMCALWTGA